MAQTRSRARTEQCLLESARQVIVEKGFAGLGINVLASQAGYDKVLIYRYFESIEGLLRVLSKTLPASVEARLTAFADDVNGKKAKEACPYGDLIPNKVARVVHIWARSIRTEPFLHAIARSEGLFENPLTEALSDHRLIFLHRSLREEEERIQLAEDLIRGQLSRRADPSRNGHHEEPLPDLSAYAVLANPPLRRGKSEKKALRRTRVNTVSRNSDSDLPVELL